VCDFYCGKSYIRQPFLVDTYMSFSTGYLTLREYDIWGLRRKNNTQSDIARFLKITRQATHKSLPLIDAKIEKAFQEAAATNQLEIRSVDFVNGIMEAYSSVHKLPVFVSLSRSNGLRVWYMHEGDCPSCSHERECRRYLEGEAAEREISLSRDEASLPPTRLALLLFQRLSGGKTIE